VRLLAAIIRAYVTGIRLDLLFRHETFSFFYAFAFFHVNLNIDRLGSGDLFLPQIFFSSKICARIKFFDLMMMYYQGRSENAFFCMHIAVA